MAMKWKFFSLKVTTIEKKEREKKLVQLKGEFSRNTNLSSFFFVRCERVELLCVHIWVNECVAFRNKKNK
jgi:hypothetical protein